MTNQSKKAIIFDFGNVIAFFDYNKVVSNFAILSDNQLSPNEVKKRLFAGNMLEKFEIGNVSSTDFIAEVKQRLNLNDTAEKEIIDTWCDLFKPNKEVIETIDKIPDDIILILGSTTNPIHFEYYRSEFSSTLDKFKSFVTSFDIGVLKPDSLFYEKCLKEANCLPNECVYVDDIPQYVEAASRIGIEGIVYNSEIDLEASLREKGVVL